MNAILSILVCIAMLFSGGATLPAQPETAVAWTLRNLTISTGADSVTLTPELRLTAAIGSEAARLQFEAVNDGETLLPVSGELNEDGLRFRLRDGGTVYAISGDVLADVDGEDAQLMELLLNYLSSYSALLNHSLQDADFRQMLSQTMIGQLVAACGSTAEPATLELDGAEIPAMHAQLEITPEAALNLLEGLAGCGVTEIEDMLDSWMGLFATAMGEDYADLSDFIEEERALLAEEDEILLPMELSWTEEAPYCIGLSMDFDVDGETAVQLAMRSTSTDERTDLDMSMGFITDDGMGSTNDLEFRMVGCVDGPANAPESVQLSLVASAQNGWESEYEEDGTVHSYSSGSNMDFSLDLSSEVVDGLEHATIDLNAHQRYTYDYDGEVNEYESGVRARLSSDERSEADGSVTTAVAIDVDIDDEPVRISWELNRADDAPVPSFDDARSVDLPADPDADAPTPGLLYLASDAIHLAGDAAALFEDASVNALLELLGLELNPAELLDEIDLSDLLGGSVYGTYATDYAYDDDKSSYDDEYDYDDGYDDDDVYDEYDDDDVYAYDDGDAPSAYSFDEAAEVYAGALPSFTVPDDLTLDYIDVSASDLYVNFSSDDGERSMDLSCYDSGDSQGEYNVLEDGALTEADAVMCIEALDEEETMFNADVVAACGTYSFSFYGFTREEVKAVLATLQF